MEKEVEKEEDYKVPAWFEWCGNGVTMYGTLVTAFVSRMD